MQFLATVFSDLLTVTYSGQIIYDEVVPNNHVINLFQFYSIMLLIVDANCC